jgi:hypothetical protein
MINFEKHIKEVLYEYDFVVLPNLGAFIANFEVLNSTPTKTFSFNHLLNSDENHKFLNYLVRIENKPLADIELQWNDFLLNLRSSLNKNKRFEINGLGSLIQNEEEGVVFKFNSDTNFYERDQFHLKEEFDEDEKETITSIVLPSEELIVPSPAVDTTTDESAEDQWIDESEVEEKAGFKKIIWLIPLLLFAAIGAYYLWNNSERRSFSQTETEVLIDSTQNELSDTLTAKLDTSTTVVDNFGNPNEENNRIKEKDSTVSKTKVPNAKYHVWAGLFKSKSNADKLLRKLRKNGLNAEIQIVKNMRRVYVPVTTEAEAKATAKKIEQLTGDKAVYFEID